VAKRGRRRVPSGVAMYPEPIGPMPTLGPPVPDVMRKPREQRMAGKMANLRGAKVRRNVGIGALAGLGGVALGTGAAKVGLRAAGLDDESLMRKAMADLMASQARSELDARRAEATGRSMQQAIEQNLGRLQAAAPDVYASVAAGRRLPQGAVVLGGAPRQDLLNELGRAMADGRFSR